MKHLLILSMLAIPWLLSSQVSQIDLFQSNARLDQRQYGNGVVTLLIQGKNLMRQGRWEDAILAYDNVVVLWPNWAPAYIKRAMAKARMGRNQEAEADLQLALRLSPNSVLLFSDRNPGAKTSLLASTTDSNPDLQEIWQLKQRGLLQQAEGLIIDLYEDDGLSATDAALLQGNLQLLRDNPQHAISYYNWALERETKPEFLHNRGLARILALNFPDGCADLQQAESLGYSPSSDQYTDLCGF